MTSKENMTKTTTTLGFCLTSLLFRDDLA